MAVVVDELTMTPEAPPAAPPTPAAPAAASTEDVAAALAQRDRRRFRLRAE